MQASDWFIEGWCTKLKKPGWKCVEAGGSRSQMVEHAEYLPLIDIFVEEEMVFTARRSYASTVLGVVILTVCPSVCLQAWLITCDEERCSLDQWRCVHCGCYILRES